MCTIIVIVAYFHIFSSINHHKLELTNAERGFSTPGSIDEFHSFKFETFEDSIDLIIARLSSGPVSEQIYGFHNVIVPNFATRGHILLMIEQRYIKRFNKKVILDIQVSISLFTEKILIRPSC